MARVVISVRRLLAPLVIAAAAAALVPAAASASSQQSTSSNWAGYVTAGTGISYKRVTATWTVPAATCAAGSASYSANWIGLGGYSQDSQALEQMGTESDCTAGGTPRYTTWSELVPRAPVTLPLAVSPGDRVTAAVTVSGQNVRMRIVNLTTGQSAVKSLTADAVDVSSAEWIVEAPSECTNGVSACTVLPLANFGSTKFLSARATTTGGYTGGIADSHWANAAITLQSGGSLHGGWGGRGFGGGRQGVDEVSQSATPTTLSASGLAFTVRYGDATTTSTPGTQYPATPTPGTPSIL